MARSGFSTRTFGHLPDGREVVAYNLQLDSGFSAEVISYGAIITSIHSADRQGQLGNVVLGFDHLEPYLLDTNYIGAVVGRVANRVAKGRFRLNDKEGKLSINHPPHHLHGGFRGFHNRLWDLEPFMDEDRIGVTCSATFLDGEEGYPGNLDFSVTYELRPPSTLLIRYAGVADRDTILNPTQHSYFNLDPQGATILGHSLQVRSTGILETSNDLVPTGRIIDPAGTAWDYRQARSLRGLSQPGHSIDTSHILEPAGETPQAILSDPRSGRKLEVRTQAPTLHIYSGQGLDAEGPDSNRRPVQPFSGICLETQGYADAPNHSSFPSIQVESGKSWNSWTSLLFLAG